MTYIRDCYVQALLALQRDAVLGMGRSVGLDRSSATTTIFLCRTATDETPMPLRNRCEKKSNVQVEVSELGLLRCGDKNPGSDGEYFLRELLSDLQALESKHAAVIVNSLRKTEGFGSIERFLEGLKSAASASPGSQRVEDTVVWTSWVHAMDRASNNVSALNGGYLKWSCVF